MLSTVTPSSTTWIRPFARTQVDHSKRPTEYHRRTGRPGKTTDEGALAARGRATRLSRSPAVRPHLRRPRLLSSRRLRLCKSKL
ncbi:hypothetical protein MTO96_027305 [Rhipicephalus appendiculatus]